MEWVTVQKLARNTLGIELSETQAAECLSRMAPLLKLENCRSLDECVERMSQSGLDQFAALVTNNETFFFREPHHFAFLVETVLGPHLLSAVQTLRLRIMSVGCAGGAEPYSMAMVVHDFLTRFSSWTCEILALDVNPGNLQFAKQAAYSRHYFRQPLLDREYQERFFTRVGSHWLLNPEIRSMVRFERSNLATDRFGAGWEGTVHALFLRNVFMYFDEATRNKVLVRAAELLHGTGFLIVATPEVPLVPPSLFSPVRTNVGTVFAKVGAAAPREASPARKTVPAALLEMAKVLAMRRKLAKPSVPAPPVDVPPGIPTFLGKLKISHAIEHFDREEFREAKTLLDDIAELAVDDPYYWLLKAHLNLNENKLTEAEEEVRLALERDSLLMEGYFVNGLIRMSKRDHETAEALFRKALFLASDFWPARVFLGEVLRQQGGREAALVQYRTALDAVGTPLASPLYQERWRKTVEEIARRGMATLGEGGGNHG